MTSCAASRALIQSIRGRCGTSPAGFGTARSTDVAGRKQSLKEFVTEALRDKLVRDTGRAYASAGVDEGLCKLKRLPGNRPRQSVVEQEFEVIEPEDRR